MAKGVNITIVSDASSVISEGKKIGSALDKVIDSLDDVGEQAKTTDRVVQTQMDNISTAAKDSSNDLETKFSQAFDKVKKDAKSTGDTVDRETRDGTGRAGEATGEFKSEALQNFSEVSSSFQGDMTSAVDLVQGTLGGLASSLPGLGLAFGVAGAAVGAIFGQMQANAAKTKQAVSDMYDDMLQSGLNYLSKDYAQTQMTAIVKGDADALIKLSDAQHIAELAGVPLSAVLSGITGDASEARRVTEGLTAATQKSSDAYDAARSSGSQDTAMLSGLYYQLDNNKRTTDLWTGSLDGATASLSTARDKVGSVRDGMDKLSGTFEHTTDSVGRLSQGIEQMPASATVKLTVDDSAVKAWARNPIILNAVARVGKPQAI